MSLNVCVIGMGYVGLTTAVGLAELDHRVTGIDIQVTRIAALQSGRTDIDEPGMSAALARNTEFGQLRLFANGSGGATVALKKASVVFICVGTPPDARGAADTTAVTGAVENIATVLRPGATIVIKSTVPPGTNRHLRTLLHALRGVDDVHVVSNPEFLREGSALQDFFAPNRIVVGLNDSRAKGLMETLYRWFVDDETPVVWCDALSAEIAKYAANALLASRLAFVNEMAQLCTVIGADISAVTQAIGLDQRIGPAFLKPGPGFGGSCFPKDTRAIFSCAQDHGVVLHTVRAAVESNDTHLDWIVDTVFATAAAHGCRLATVAVLGLAFKAGTSDTRTSAAHTVVRTLLTRGTAVIVHDPVAESDFRAKAGLSPGAVTGAARAEDAITLSDAVIVLTEWPEFADIDWRQSNDRMRLVFDTRDIVNGRAARAAGHLVWTLGRPVVAPTDTLRRRNTHSIAHRRNGKHLAGAPFEPASPVANRG